MIVNNCNNLSKKTKVFAENADKHGKRENIRNKKQWECPHHKLDY